VGYFESKKEGLHELLDDTPAEKCSGDVHQLSEEVGLVANVRDIRAADAERPRRDFDHHHAETNRFSGSRVHTAASWGRNGTVAA
jgi:hypothetical protein